ncbi:MAG: cyclic nucleotide-binding domain-containing protein [bacterium]
MPRNLRTNNSNVKFKAGDSIWRNVFNSDLNQKETIFSILKKIPLFKGMGKSELREFDRIIHRRRFKEEETIFWEGEPGVGMYIVQEGSVAIYQKSGHTEKEVLARLNRGEFFGELALLDESPRSATATALEDSKILGLYRPDLMSLIERKPRLGNKFLFQLAMLIGERLKHTNKELQTLWNKLEDSKVIT